MEIPRILLIGKSYSGIMSRFGAQAKANSSYTLPHFPYNIDGKLSLPVLCMNTIRIKKNIDRASLTIRSEKRANYAQEKA